MLKSLFGGGNEKSGFKWIEAWRNETKNKFSVVLKEIQTNQFIVKNFDHNTVLEDLVEFPSITLIQPFNTNLLDNNDVIHQKKDKIFLINLTCVDGDTSRQTVSIISAADIVLDSVRNSITLLYISSYRNYKTSSNELERFLVLRADDLGIPTPSVANNKEELNNDSYEFSSRDSYSSEETHDSTDSLEIPVDPPDDHLEFYDKKNTHPLENLKLVAEEICVPSSASIDTQQFIRNKSIDSGTQDYALSGKFVFAPTKTCDNRNNYFIDLTQSYPDTSSNRDRVFKYDGEKTLVNDKSTTPKQKYKRNRRIQKYIFSSQYSGQSDPEPVEDTISTSSSPSNPQPSKRNKRAAPSPF